MPKPINTMPAQLAEIIALHNEMFAGATMMADEQPPAEQSLEDAVGAQLTGQQPETPKTPETGDEDKDYKGAGSKEQLKADLASERDKRQQEQAKVTELKAKIDQLTQGLSQALGIKDDEAQKVTPEQLTQQLTTTQAERDALAVEVAIYRTAPAGVDAAALLDSRAFTDSLQGVDPKDSEALNAKVTAFVDANPRFKQRTGSTGDLYEGRQNFRPEPAPGVPALRDAVERELNRK